MISKSSSSETLLLVTPDNNVFIDLIGEFRILFKLVSSNYMNLFNFSLENNNIEIFFLECWPYSFWERNYLIQTHWKKLKQNFTVLSSALPIEKIQWNYFPSNFPLKPALSWWNATNSLSKSVEFQLITYIGCAEFQSWLLPSEVLGISIRRPIWPIIRVDWSFWENFRMKRYTAWKSISKELFRFDWKCYHISLTKLSSFGYCEILLKK